MKCIREAGKEIKWNNKKNLHQFSIEFYYSIKHMVRIEEITAEDTYQIRKDILRKNMTLSHVMHGDLDQDTLHLGVFAAEELVCIGSFMKASCEGLSGSQYQLRGMATKAKSQGRGYGKLLMKKAEITLADKGIDIIWCNARVKALEFYKKLGYQMIGEQFDVAQVGPHFKMFKVLK